MWQPNPIRYLPAQVELANTIRRILIDHTRWVRALIGRIIFNIGGQVGRKAVEERLEQISSRLADLFADYYGEEFGKRVQETYHDYTNHAELMIEAYRDNNLNAAAEHRRILYGIADEFAQLAAGINRYWDFATMQIIIRDLVNTTEEQISSIISADFEQDADAYDNFTDQSYRLADGLTYGILRQFQV